MDKRAIDLRSASLDFEIILAATKELLTLPDFGPDQQAWMEVRGMNGIRTVDDLIKAKKLTPRGRRTAPGHHRGVPEERSSDSASVGHGKEEHRGPDKELRHDRRHHIHRRQSRGRPSRRGREAPAQNDARGELLPRLASLPKAGRAMSVSLDRRAIIK